MWLKGLSRLNSYRFPNSSQFYTKFPGNLPQAALTALIYMTKVPKAELNYSLESFRSKIHTSQSSIPESICSLLSAPSLDTPLSLPNPLSSTYSDLFSKLTHAKQYISHANSLTLTPGGISEALKVIYEFCDKGKIGFLSGDLSFELIEVLLSHVASIETENIQDNHEIYNKIEEYLLEQEFCLPKFGIPFPDKENPQAMFIRELLIEKDSPEIIMNKIKNDMELLTHSAFGLNYLTPKEHLINLFSTFCRRIRQEQEMCVRKELSNTRKKYSHLLVFRN